MKKNTPYKQKGTRAWVRILCIVLCVLLAGSSIAAVLIDLLNLL